MADAHLSNARDYEIMAGRVCPHCGETRLIEPVRVGWFCQVCAKTWPALPTPYRG